MAGQLIHPFRAVESFLPASQSTITSGDFIYDHGKSFISVIYMKGAQAVFFHKTSLYGQVT
jgi:hypothetical protein